MADPNRNALVADRSLKDQLKGKSRQRRDALARLSAPSGAPRPARNDVTPLLELVRIPIGDLRTMPRRVRKGDAAHVRDVAGAISALGFCVPILIGKDNLVLDGEARLEAARHIGLATVPAIRIDHLIDCRTTSVAACGQSAR